MSPDEQVLLLVLGLIYLTACAAWVPTHTVVFTSRAGWRFRWRLPGFGNRNGGLIVAPPLMPLGHLHLCLPWPVSLSPEGAFSWSSQALSLAERPGQEERFVHLSGASQIDVVAAEVHVDGRPFLRCRSSALARHVGRGLRRLASSPVDERAAIIEDLVAQRLDTSAIKARLTQLGDHTRILKLACNVQLTHVFVITPAAMWAVGLAQCWPWILLGALGLDCLVAWAWYSARRALQPHVRAPVFEHMLTIFISPLDAIRAGDTLSRDLLIEFEPTAVAQVLCSQEEASRLAQRTLIDLRYPLEPASPPGTPEQAAATEQWLRLVRLKALEEFLRSDTALDPDELLAPPVPQDATCRSWCPRCRCQFTLEAGTCSDCGDIPLTCFQGASETA